MGYVFNTDPNDAADLQAQLDDVCAMYNTATATLLRQAREIRRLKVELKDTQDALTIASGIIARQGE